MPRKYGKKAATAAQDEQPQSYLTVVDFSQEIHRWLYQPLYSAVLDQALLMGDTEEWVRQKFAMLMAGNPNHGMVAELVGDKVQSHCTYNMNAPKIFIEQFCGTQEFILTVQRSLENDYAPAEIIYFVDEDNADFFIDTLGYEVQKVMLVKRLTTQEAE